MALRTDHFVDPTFRGSNWSPTEQLAKGFQNSLKKQAIFIEIITVFFFVFFYGWYRNSFISKELALKEPLDDVMLHTENCLDFQMVVRTDHFVDRTMRGSNWSPTEQLVKDS